jgi:eukaryotic-like serine/threonine-protein kinase
MTQLSRYILLEKIGSSVLGALYKAQDTATGSLVALKVLQLGLLDDVSRDEMDARLQRDFEAATRLQHPGIARVFEIRRDGRTALIASELVEGPTITSLTKNQTGSDLSQVVAATVQLLEALDFAHIQSVIHRDVKPSNVLIQGGRIKITDFGMADLAARNRYDTGALVGESEYMAPEQFLSGTIDKRCDIHAVGTILYQLLTGKSPFRGDPHTAAAMFNVLQLVPPPPSEVRSGLSSAFDLVVARALAKLPAERFVTAREFRNELFAAYVTLMGRPPPESLVPVTITPPAPAQEDSTVVQRRRTLQILSAVTREQPAEPRAPAEIPRGYQPEKPPPSPVVESFGPRSPAPLRAAAASGPASSQPPEPVKRSAPEAVRAQPAPVSEAVSEPTLPEESAPDMREAAGAAGASLESPELVRRPVAAERISAQARRREPDRVMPSSGGTVLAWPEAAMAAPAAADPQELMSQTVPPDAALAQPVRAKERGADGLVYGGTVLASPTRAAAGQGSLPQELVRQALAVNAVLAQPARTERPENGRVPSTENDRTPIFYPGTPAASVVAPGLRSKLASMTAEPAPVASTPIEPRAHPGSAPSAESPTGPMPTRAAPLPPKRIIPLTDASIAHGGRVLAHFIGPIAIVFSRRAAQDAHDERGYFELLAAHLEDPDERTQFFRKVRQRPA